MKPTIVKDTNEVYHSKGEFISSSNIAGIRTLKEYYYNKFIKVWESKSYFDIGTAAHAYILEPDLFKNSIICVKNEDFPEPEKVNKDGSLTMRGKNKTFFDKFVVNNIGKIIFQEYYFNEVVKYAKSFKLFPDFDNLFDLKTGETEKSFYGECFSTGLKVKIRPDFFRKNAFIGDLKFERDISDYHITRSFADYEYHVRAAFIVDNYNHFTGENIDTFIFAFAEKKEPYHVRIMELSSVDLNSGREIYLTRLEAIKKAAKDNKWRGFEKETGAESIEKLELPNWIYKNVNNNFLI